jgi:PLP dependent protein
MQALKTVLQEIANVAQRSGRPPPRLLAVSKHQPATAIAELVACAHELADVAGAGFHERAPAFGENYVQEARVKRESLSDLALEWHLIGHLQSNKAADAATLFDWVQTVDRSRLAEALSRHRPADGPALNVLIQVNIDDEPSKHGCTVGDVERLASQIDAMSNLALRGLMVIPAPVPDPRQRRDAFRRTRVLFDDLRAHHPAMDTLSMGMSDDYPLAIEEGSTMIRLGTALFGPRPPREPRG